MRNQGVGSWTARRARMSAGRVAVVHDDREWTYAQLHERVTRLAHALAGMGVGHRDRVAYLGPNHPTFLEALFGAGQLGAVFLPLNWRLAPAELAYILRDAGARVLLAGPDQGAVAARLADLVRVPTLAAGEDYERTLAAAGNRDLDERVDPDDCCMIMYTSGTTGRPKGVMLAHAAIAWNSFNLLLDVDLTSEEVTLVGAPMFHAAALNQTVLPTLLKGGRVVLVSSFDPDRTLELIARHRVTYLFGVPTMFLAMARAPGWADADLSSVRSAICGGAPVPEAVIAAYQARGVTFLQGYGLTEAGPGVLFLRRDDSVRKAGSAGTATFFADVRLMPPDGGTVAPGEPGEIVVQGPNVMAGYWNRPEDTAAVLPADGWLHTGDLGVADADGYITILDRSRDLIISGGENIYPAEVENALYGHPAVAECAVIGVPDEHWGEVGRALVVPHAGARLDAADLLTFLADRIAKYKIPKSVVFTDALPRSTFGKILKSELRSRFGVGDERSTAVPTVTNGLAELRALAGADLGTSEWLEITQDRVNAFAGATGDDQWIHVDVDRARTGPFGGTVAHGYLTLALVIPLWTEMLRIEGIDMAINYGLNRLRFPAPVPVGSKIRLRARVATVTDVPDGVQLTAELTVELRGAAKPAAVVEALFRYYGAGTAGHGRRLS